MLIYIYIYIYMNTEIIFKLILIFFLIYCIIKCYTKKDIEKYADIDQKSSEIEKASAEAAGKAAAVSSTVSISAAAIAAVVAALNSASSPTVPSYNTLKDNNQCLQKVTNENCMRCLYDIGVNANAGNQFGNSANYCRTTEALNKMLNAGEIGYDNLKNRIQNNDGYSKNSYKTPPCGPFFNPVVPTNKEITNYRNCRKDSIEKARKAEAARQTKQAEEARQVEEAKQARQAEEARKEVAMQEEEKIKKAEEAKLAKEKEVKGDNCNCKGGNERGNYCLYWDTGNENYPWCFTDGISTNCNDNGDPTLGYGKSWMKCTETDMIKEKTADQLINFGYEKTNANGKIKYIFKNKIWNGGRDYQLDTDFVKIRNKLKEFRKLKADRKVGITKYSNNKNKNYSELEIDEITDKYFEEENKAYELTKSKYGYYTMKNNNRAPKNCDLDNCGLGRRFYKSPNFATYFGLGEITLSTGKKVNLDDLSGRPNITSYKTILN